MLNIRRIVAAAASAAAVTGVIAVAGASPAAAAYSTVESCTGVSGKITYQPGLTKKVKKQQAVLVGTLTGCSSAYSGPQDGNGTISAVLAGRSKVGAVTETGTATINWPATSGLNPTNATITIRETGAGQAISLSGPAISGAFTGAPISTTLLPYAQTGKGTKHHPLKSQSVLNTAAFAVKVNLG
jgi:hypothetical protein